MTKQINKLERSRGLLMQISLIASLLIVLLIFESKSKTIEEDLRNFTEINIEIEHYTNDFKNIKPPNPNTKSNTTSEQTNIVINYNDFNFNNSIVDKPAKFPKGEDALINYLKENMHYPAEAKKKDIQGRIYVSFIITKKGQIEDAEIIRKIHPLIDTEALRLIKSMPNWIPAETNGEPIESKQVLPIIFMNFDN